ncbi:MAG TPA: hypothetical protein VM305_04130 [Candidatus Limnocylindrales bacterium]|nr:hypothetical protein [Candidatus Limnocylindrales bacterium]
MIALDQARLVIHGFAAGIDCPGPESQKVVETESAITVKLDDRTGVRVEATSDGRFVARFMIDGREAGPWRTRTASATRLALVLRSFHRRRHEFREAVADQKAPKG